MTKLRKEVLKIDKQYQERDIIYPDVIAKQMGITIEQAYRECEELKKKGLLKNVYVLHCLVCGHAFPTRYYSLTDIELTTKSKCGNCGCESVLDLQNIFVYYERRIKGDKL